MERTVAPRVFACPNAACAVRRTVQCRTARAGPWSPNRCATEAHAARTRHRRTYPRRQRGVCALAMDTAVAPPTAPRSREPLNVSVRLCLSSPAPLTGCAPRGRRGVTEPYAPRPRDQIVTRPLPADERPNVGVSRARSKAKRVGWTRCWAATLQLRLHWSCKLPTQSKIPRISQWPFHCSSLLSSIE